MSKVTLIVSAFNRPDHLRCCLASLVCQTFPDWDAIVTDNAMNEAHQRLNLRHSLMDDRISYQATYVYPLLAMSPYHSGEHVALNVAKGEWLGFPSDDSYYPPIYLERMLAVSEDADLVYADHVMMGNPSRILYTEPRECHIDKTGFLIRRSMFTGFPGKSDGPTNSDGLMVQNAVSRGARCVKVNEPLVIHN